jgi:hypothetical protein
MTLRTFYFMCLIAFDINLFHVQILNHKGTETMFFMFY